MYEAPPAVQKFVEAEPVDEIDDASVGPVSSSVGVDVIVEVVGPGIGVVLDTPTVESDEIVLASDESEATGPLVAPVGPVTAGGAIEAEAVVSIGALAASGAMDCASGVDSRGVTSAVESVVAGSGAGTLVSTGGGSTAVACSCGAEIVSCWVDEGLIVASPAAPLGAASVAGSAVRADSEAETEAKERPETTTAAVCAAVACGEGCAARVGTHRAMP